MRKDFFRKDLLKERLFQLLVFLLPTQLACHFWPDFSLIFGIRVDYLAPTIYLTDLLVFLLFLLSIKKIDKKSVYLFFKKYWLLMAFLLLLVAGNVYLADIKEAAFLKWLKVGELFLLANLIAREKNFKIKEWFFKPLVYSSILFSLIGIVQFLMGRTIGGAFYLLGERSFSLAMPGIALVKIFGVDYLRAYSTFSHPNSLAGFFAVVVYILLWFKGGATLKKVSLFLVLLVILLSFSRAAIAAFLIVSAVFFFMKEIKTEKVKQKFYLFVFSATLIFSLILSVISDRVAVNGKIPSDRIYERIILNQAAGKMFVSSPVFGVGLNNFIPKLTNYAEEPNINWLLQPVHNFYLLVLTEAGLLGLIVFSFLLYKIICRIKNPYLGCAFLVILLTGLMDHYWFTLQQNQLLLVILFGLSFRKSID